MTKGTIHAVDQNLVLVEGDWPKWPAVSLPGSTILRSEDRLYLIDTGAGQWHRSAIQAIVASFGRPAELVLVNSGQHPGLVGNNDLLDHTPAGVRRHLGLPRAGRSDFAGRLAKAVSVGPDDAGPVCAAAFEPGEVSAWVETVLAAYPPVRPTSVVSTDLIDCTDTPLRPIGGTGWTGWHLGDDLIAIEATAASARLLFYLPEQRMVLLPDELALAPLWPGTAVQDVIRIGTDVVNLLDTGTVDVVGFGFGPPQDTRSARETIERLIARARRFEVTTMAMPGETPVELE